MAGETILIVEDDAISATHLQYMLQGLGYTVSGPVSSGEEGLSIATSRRTDLILMDIELTGTLNGIAAAEKIVAVCDVPIIFLTSYSQDSLLQQAKATSPYGYLVKPVAERELMATIEMALHRHMLDIRLKESEDKYRSLFEHAIEGIFQTTPDGRFISANPAQAKIFGYDSPEELMEHITDIGAEQYVNPQDRETYRNTIEAEGIIRGFETQLFNKDKRPIWVSINARAVKDDQGRVVSYEGTTEDITERKVTEAALAKKTDELERFNRLMVNREIKMIALKKEINMLLTKAGKKEKYKVHDNGEEGV